MRMFHISMPDLKPESLPKLMSKPLLVCRDLRGRQWLEAYGKNVGTDGEVGSVRAGGEEAGLVPSWFSLYAVVVHHGRCTFVCVCGGGCLCMCVCDVA